jgi:hypothetical protein
VVHPPLLCYLRFFPKLNIKFLPEQVVTNKKRLKDSEQSKSIASLPADPWISMRNGAIIITFTSIGMAVLTAIQVVPVKGWVEGILWGLLYGGMIWVIFFGLVYVNRFLKRK